MTLVQEQELIEHVRSVLTTERSLSESDRKILLSLLSAGGSSDQDAQIVQHDSIDINPHQHDPLDKMHTDRIRMVAVSAAARRGDVAILQEFFENEAAQPFGAIEHYSGGVRACQVCGAQVILLPEPLTNLHCWQILNALNKIYLAAPRSGGWIVDCSAIEAQEALIYSSLLGYKKAFSRESEGVRLIWVKPHSLPQLIAARLVSEFRLEKVGGFYFSR